MIGAKMKTVNKLYKIDAYFDVTLAYEYFNDFIHINKDLNKALFFYSDRGSLDYMVFSDNFNSSFYATDDLDKLDDLDRLFICETLGLYEDEIKEYLDDVLTLTIEDYYTFLHKEKHWHDLDYTFILSGYSQGDAIKILDLTKGQEYSNDSYKKYLHNIIFDAPITIVLIDSQGGIYYLGEYLDLSYEYDRDKIILDFSNIPEEYRLEDHDLILDVLKFMLPKELEYK